MNSPWVQPGDEMKKDLKGASMAVVRKASQPCTAKRKNEKYDEPKRFFLYRRSPPHSWRNYRFGWLPCCKQESFFNLHRITNLQ